ncbi:TPM domain-containing protein [Nodosilinea sp. LEGE 06152]|uniref:TPM domain-containing protein n=1 Tax=Nodosilinea sp. LEGE 06152 TaxID=2777966 RepID=UPI0018828B12|nr:TPM domain-containing protein [Nodosilinea sp. LEGE 06152]MBE9155271.1 TPM domain-containing protein [Nodosilinea sp. LEGE 06152]
MSIKSVTISRFGTLGLGRVRYWLLAVVSAIALLLPALVGPAQAAYPAFQDAYVNDYGQVLSASDKSQVRAQLEQFRSRTGVHAVLLTVNSIYDYGTGDDAIEPFATNLFNTWGIGNAARNDGILLLVAPGDRKVRIELGSGYDRSYDRVAQAIIDDAILPQFRQGNISQGTAIGVNEIIESFDPSQPPAVNPLLSYVPPALANWVSPEVAIGGGLAAGGVGAVSGLFALGHWKRYHKRNCPQCQVEMERLDEQADDRYLNAGQRAEESIKSVDYDVWLCRSCDHHEVFDYSSFGSGYQKCPGCRHKTMKVSSHTLVSPTYHSTGTAEISEVCGFCDRTHHYTRTIPMKTPPSSSSSSGGGHSSGGGASGSW